MSQSTGFFAVFASLSLSLAACSGVAPSTSASGTTASSAADGGAAPTTPTDGGTSTTNPTGAGTGTYIIVLHADQTPVAVDPNSSGETPTDQRIGFLGLRLLENADDDSPLVVANLSAPVDVGYNDGDDTIIATVPAKNLRAGHFTVAQVPIAYVRFTVGGTYHSGGAALVGDFSDVIAMANSTMIDGASHDQGYWETTFASTSGPTYGYKTGESAVVAQPGATSGIALDTASSPSQYVFATSLDVDPNLDHDVRVVFHVNTYQDFRWQDQTATDYAPGVFDVSSAGFETVTQLGANSIATRLE